MWADIQTSTFFMLEFVLQCENVAVRLKPSPLNAPHLETKNSRKKELVAPHCPSPAADKQVTAIKLVEQLQLIHTFCTTKCVCWTHTQSCWASSEVTHTHRVSDAFYSWNNQFGRQSRILMTIYQLNDAANTQLSYDFSSKQVETFV